MIGRIIAHKNDNVMIILYKVKSSLKSYSDKSSSLQVFIFSHVMNTFQVSYDIHILI